MTSDPARTAVRSPGGASNPRFPLHRSGPNPTLPRITHLLRPFARKPEFLPNRFSIGRRSYETTRLRVAGKIPAVVYGTSGSFGLTVDQAEFRDLSRSVGDAAAIVELEKTKGEVTLSVIQEVQRDPLKDRVNHIDFLEVVL